MPETVRLVSDGEEMVLSEGEVYRIRSGAEARQPGQERTIQATAPKLALKYVGFRDVEGRREYALNAQLGQQTRRYTISIDLTVFSRRQALLQDGPDICYQKLLHELTGLDLEGSDGFAVNDTDLAAYREAHPAPARRSFSPTRTPDPAKAAAQPAPPDGNPG